MDVSDLDLKDHLGIILQRGFPSLRKLTLHNTKLTTNDVESLADIMVQGQLNLEELDLTGNNLTNLLGMFLGIRGNPDDPRQLTDNPGHPGFPHRSRLFLSGADLNSGDIYILTKAICCRKLPHLEYLYIGDDTPPDRNDTDNVLEHFCRQYNISIA